MSDSIQEAFEEQGYLEVDLEKVPSMYDDAMRKVFLLHMMDKIVSVTGRYESLDDLGVHMKSVAWYTVVGYQQVVIFVGHAVLIGDEYNNLRYTEPVYFERDTIKLKLPSDYTVKQYALRGADICVMYYRRDPIPRVFAKKRD